MINGMATAEILEPEAPPMPAAAPQLVVLTRDKDIAWLLMPDVMKRIKDFCRENDTESDPEMLANVVMQDFARPVEERNFYLSAAIYGAKVVGHLLAMKEVYCKKTNVAVMQFSIDHDANMPRGLLHAGFDLLQDWANLHMAIDIRAQVPTRAHARRLQIFYGFKPYRLLMKKEI